MLRNPDPSALIQTPVETAMARARAVGRQCSKPVQVVRPGATLSISAWDNLRSLPATAPSDDGSRLPTRDNALRVWHQAICV